MSGVTMGYDKHLNGPFGLPTEAIVGGSGSYGPNAMFGTPSSVPEASSFALLLAGAAPLGFMARKRLRRKA